MTHTTAISPLELDEIIPGIAAYQGAAVRLHPRRGAPDRRGSHIGGPLLWPADEPWPTCSEPDCMLTLNDITEGPSPYIGFAQLTAVDFPEIPFPEGTDLVQVLFCGMGHTEPEPARVYWRRAADITEILAEPPLPDIEDWMYRELVPWPCTLDPERVSEYPWPEQLPDDLRARLRAWQPEPHEWFFPKVYEEVAMAPGCKVGGCMSFSSTDMPRLECGTCHAPLFMLLQIYSHEWDAYGQPESRWWPLEERHLVPRTSDFMASCQPIGFSDFRGGIFICADEPRHPAHFIAQV